MKKRHLVIVFLMFYGSLALAAETIMATATQRDAVFERGIALFEGSQFEQALDLIRPLAESGHANAQYQMGLMYTWGVGVPQDETLAQGWYTKAFERIRVNAERGDGEAMADLGLMLDEGQGVGRDVDAALSWLKKGIEVDNPSAIAYMGDMYLYGHGVPQSISEALNWYRQSADLGNDYALTMLRRLEETMAVSGGGCSGAGC
ncbi:MAG: sel1 repeat family protein [Gammaproteobacteria bacterium]|nr:sel1 repeat family protein [Gammaproteobacteria bacterium]